MLKVCSIMEVVTLLRVWEMNMHSQLSVQMHTDVQQKRSSTKEKRKDQRSIRSNKSEMAYTLLLIYRFKVCDMPVLSNNIILNIRWYIPSKLVCVLAKVNNCRSYCYKGTLFDSVVYNSSRRCRREFVLFWHLVEIL